MKQTDFRHAAQVPSGLRQFFKRSLALTLAIPSFLLAEGSNWYAWRGPNQNGTATETFTNAFEEKPLWTAEIAGRGAPVIADGIGYLFGYKGQLQDIYETLTAFDPATGKILWELKLADFLSDNAYNRYAIGSPTIDPETGKVYLLTTPGLLLCVDKTGKILWEHSLMEEVGRLSFPNGRTGAPVIVNDLVIVRGITANWGGDGPARDRLYAYHKETGDLVYSSAPGEQPQDSSFGTPLLDFMPDGRPVLYMATGCGNYCAVNALTGKPMWRWKAAKGGVNSSIVKYKDTLISIHDKECVDVAEFGRLSSVRIPAGPLPAVVPPADLTQTTQGWDVPVVAPEAEVWRLPLVAETSSPTLVGDTLYQLDQSGNLHSIDAATGKENWHKKLSPGNSHSSPLYANGLLYCPMQNDSGSEDGLLYVIKPGKESAEVLHVVKLESYCLAPPALSNGKLYIASAKKLYCFQVGKGEIKSGDPKWPGKLPKAAGPAVSLQIIPQEVLLNPAGRQKFIIRGVDANGYPTADKIDSVAWESFIPPTAKVRSTLDASFENGELVAKPEAKPSAGAFKATAGKLIGTIRGRVLPSLPLVQDFEKFELITDNIVHPDGLKFAYPPLPWIGARLKFEVHEQEGNKVFYKTVAPVFFQRGLSFIGSALSSNYTIQADVMLPKVGRTRGEAGVVNQRYVIMLNGNAGELEVNSNHERLKVSTPFKTDPKKWYTIQSRVDLNKDGSGVIKAKVWEQGTEQPAAWTLEVPHKIAHKNGSPGLFGFALQGRVPVYLDNVAVTPNK